VLFNARLAIYLQTQTSVV